MLNFVESFFCIYLDDHMVFLLQFVNMVYHVDWFAYIEESLHPWDKSHLIMVYDPFMCCWISPSLSLVTVFILKSILSDTSISTPAFFWFPCAWNNFFHPFTFSLYVFLGLKWVSCRQHIYGSCFCIHSASLCLLVGAFI